MFGTLFDVCWWLTKGACSGVMCVVPPDPIQPLRRRIDTLEARVQQLEEKLDARLETSQDMDIDEFDILPVTLGTSQ